MTEWKSLLNADAIPWLLEDNNPSVRYLTLKEILDRPKTHLHVLEMLLILTGLGLKDNRMKDALDLVLSKQDDRGRWNLEMTYNSRFQVNIERKGKPSKWVTLNAMRVLTKYYG